MSAQCGGQHKASQDVPHWYVDYFELEITLATGREEASAPLPLIT